MMTTIQTGMLEENEPASQQTTGEPELIGEAEKWFILVRPYRPPAQRASGLLNAGSTQKAQQVFQQVAQILSVGPLCNQAVTTSGLDFKTVRPLQVGDWVVYPAHCGTEIPTNNVLLDDVGDKYTDLLKIVKETDVVMRVKDPSMIWSWVPGK